MILTFILICFSESPRSKIKTRFSFVFSSLIRTFDFVEGTLARKLKEKWTFLLYSPRLFVPLHILLRLNFNDTHKNLI